MRRSLIRYGLPVFAILAAFIFHLAMERHFGVPLSPYIIFFPIIMAVAVFAGFRPSMVVTLLAALLTLQFRPSTIGNFALESRSDNLSLAFFFIAAVGIAFFAEFYRGVRKRAVDSEQELALRESERRYRTVVEMSPEAVVVHQDGAIVYANAAAVRLYGADSPQHLEGKQIMWLVPADDRDKVRERLQVAEWGMFAPLRETRILRMNGTEVAVEATSGGVDWYGKVAVLTILRDITERKRAEAALIQSEKLASVGRMAASIAHEINNPLAAVMNTLYIARNTAGLPLAAMNYMDLAEEELKRISYITRQVLGFYRESGAFTCVRVSEIMDSALDLLQSRIKAKHTHVEVEYRDPLEVTAIRGELRQVFSNLLVNSIESIADHGTIRIRISRAHGARVGELAVRITVADNGPGIRKEIRERIFEALFTTKDATGTGLGLWVSRQIVEKHGGSIRFRSTTTGAHTGTVFSVVLVAAESADSATAISGLV